MTPKSQPRTGQRAANRRHRRTQHTQKLTRTPKPPSSAAPRRAGACEGGGRRLRLAHFGGGGPGVRVSCCVCCYVCCVLRCRLFARAVLSWVEILGGAGALDPTSGRALEISKRSPHMSPRFALTLLLALPLASALLCAAPSVLRADAATALRPGPAIMMGRKFEVHRREEEEQSIVKGEQSIASRVQDSLLHVLTIAGYRVRNVLRTTSSKWPRQLWPMRRRHHT